MTLDEAFAQWLAPSGYGYFDVAGDGHPQFTLDPMRRTGDYNESGMQLPAHIGAAATSGNNDPGDLARQWFDKLNTADASGRMPWGSALIPFEDSGSAWDPTRAAVNINGQERLQTGTDINGILSPKLQETLRQQGIDPATFISYDPTYGYTAPADQLRAMYPARQAEALAGEGFLDSGVNLAGLMAAAVGGVGALAGGAGAAGTAGDSLWGSLYSDALAGTGPFATGAGLGDAAWGVNPQFGSDLTSGGLESLINPQTGMLQSLAPNFLGAQTAAFAGPGSTLGIGGGANLLSSIANWLTPSNGISGLQGLGLLSSGVQGIAGALGATSAANTAANAANRATDTQLGMFNTINQQQLPYRLAGYSSLGSIMGGLGLGPASGGVDQGQFTHQFDANDLKTNLAPNYQFQLDQGLGALRNQMNVNSGQLSGNTLKGINDYAQNFAGNAYQNAFNNYNANQTNIFNRLSNIAGLGQTANANVGNAGTSLANAAGQNQVAAGQAQAAGITGATNAITGGLNNAMGWYSLPSILNMFNGSANG